MSSTRFNRGCTEHDHAANSGDVDQGRDAGQFTTSCTKTNPFPEDAIRQPTPSPGPSHRRWCGQRHCILLHVLILNSLPLGAVQMKHTSILVRHCNLLMLQVGEPGDGASVSFWMDVQVFSYYGHKWKARAEATYDRLLHERTSDPENIRAPTKECPEDSLLNKGVRRSRRLYDDSGGHNVPGTTRH